MKGCERGACNPWYGSQCITDTLNDSKPQIFLIFLHLHGNCMSVLLVLLSWTKYVQVWILRGRFSFIELHFSTFTCFLFYLSQVELYIRISYWWLKLWWWFTGIFYHLVKVLITTPSWNCNVLLEQCTFVQFAFR